MNRNRINLLAALVIRRLVCIPQLRECSCNRCLARCFLALFFVLTLLFANAIHADIGGDNPTGPCGQFNGNVTTGCSYDPYTANATRSITDITVAGGTGEYPLSFARTMTTRYIAGVSTEFGPAGSWRHSYQWSIDTVTVTSGRPNSYKVNYPDGRRISFDRPNVANPDVVPRWQGPSGVRDRFEHLSDAHPNDCYLILPDGGQIWFRATITHPSNQNRYKFTFKGIIDPYGQKTLITHPNNQYMQITEPAGRWLRIHYRAITNPSEGHVNDVVVDYVDASDARRVSYTYQAYVTGDNTRYTSLSQVRYFGTAGWDSFYSYQAGSGAARPLIKTCIDPMFDGPMWRIWYSLGTNVDGVYGRLFSEKYYDGVNMGVAVSSLSVDTANHQRTETRGDAGNPTRTFTYSANGYKLRQVGDFYGINASQTYDPDTGFLASATDRENNVTTYQCNLLNGNIEKITSATPVDVLPSAAPTVIQYHYGRQDCAHVDDDNPYYVCEVVNGPRYDRYPGDPRTTPGAMEITTITYPSTQAGQSTEQFTYNQYGQVATHKMRNNYTEQWNYDDQGNPSRVTAYYDGAHPTNGHPTAWYRYNSLGRLAYIIDGRGNSQYDTNFMTSFGYNARGQLVAITHPDGSTIRYYYNWNGTFWATTDERHSNSNNPDDATVYTYDDYKRVRTVATPKRSQNDNLPRTTTYYYDPNGVGEDRTRTADVPTKVVSPGSKVVKTTYDNNLRATYVTAVGDSNVSNAVTHYVYDHNGNVLSVTDPNNNITNYYYDALDRVKFMSDPIPADRDTDGYTMRYYYDVSGNLVKQKRADGKTCTFDYDPMGFMKSRTGYASEYTEYVPDIAGNLYKYKFKKADNTFIVYQYDYDGLNRLKKVTYPQDAPPDNQQRYEQYTYDIANQLYQYRNPAGQIKTLTYDARSRLTNTSWNSNGPSVIIAYDTASRPQSITSTESGITTIVGFGFDEANNRTYEDQTINGFGTHRVQTDPNADGNRSNLLVKTGNTTNLATYFDYTSRNELLNIRDSNNALFFTYSYDAAGNVTKRLGQRLGDYTEVPAGGYDGLNRPKQWNLYGYHGGNLGANTQYFYTKIGNLDHTIRSDYGGGKGDWFAYDELSQLATSPSAVYKATSLTDANFDKKVTYVGGNRNRTSMTVVDHTVTPNTTTTTTYTPVDLNEYKQINGLNILWDNNFNLTDPSAYNGCSYTYDAENRLITANGAGGDSAGFYYDGLGRCVGRIIDGVGVIYTYDQWTPVAEWDGSGNLLATNVFGLGDDEILYRSAGSAQYYYKSDAMGNVKFILNGNNNAAGLEKYNYDAFGKATITDWNGSNRRSASNYGNRFMFSGREYFNELGLYDMRNRVYDPVMGRFYQTDPIGLQGDPLNLYRFCGNNPLLGGDPFGLEDEDSDFTFSLELGGPTGIFEGVSEAGPWASANWWGDPISDTTMPWGSFSGGVGSNPFNGDPSLISASASYRTGNSTSNAFRSSTSVALSGQDRSVLPTLKIGGPLAPAQPPAQPGFGSWVHASWDDAKMVTNWAIGFGHHLDFGPNSVEAQWMQNAPGVQNAVARFWWNNTGVSDWTQSARVRYQAGFGLGGLHAAGVNPTQQFVGSFTAFIHGSGPSAVQVTLWNQTSLRSLMADRPFIPYYNRGVFPIPGADATQTITFRLPYP